VIGEVTGMMIATALGWGDVASIALAVALAFLFGYSLTSLPLLRARLLRRHRAHRARRRHRVNRDHGSDRQRLHAARAGRDGGDFRFWAPLLGGFVIAWPFALAVNRAMIRRGKGHAVVHQYHTH
jgi:hypothetical protein